MRSILPALTTLALAAASLTLFSCLSPDDDSPQGTEVENEVTGRLYLAGGREAAGATVRLIPVGYLPQAGSGGAAGIRIAVTDAEGRYRFDSLQAGEYNILGKLGDGQSFQDSVPVAKGTDSLPSDTLEAPGFLAGRVALEPNHDPRTATVQVLGTEVFVNVDAAGRFTLGPLAAGTYRARIVTTEAEYTPLFSGFTVRVGATDTLSRPWRPTFTGIPVVTGLSGRYDSARGTAHISWRPVEYANLQYYAVYRDQKGATILSTQPQAFVEDTIFSDTLLRLVGPSLYDTVPVDLEYRVRAVSRSDIQGLGFEKATVRVVPVSWVATTVDIRPDMLGNAVRSIGDTLRFIARYDNPRRRNREIRWYLGASSDPLAIRTLAGKTGEDTVIFKAPPYGVRLRIHALVADEAGSIWRDSLNYEVIWDDPRADAGKDTVVSVGDTVRLAARGFDLHGEILARAWDIGNTGRFTPTTRTETTFVAPLFPQEALQAVLLVTDDDGRTGWDVKYVHVVADVPVARAGADTVFTIGDSIRLAGKAMDRFGYIARWEWDIGATGNFVRTAGGDTVLPPATKPGSFRAVLKVTDDDGMTAQDTVAVSIRASRIAPPLSQARYDMPAVTAGGKVYVFGGWTQDKTFGSRVQSNKVAVFDTATRTWSDLATMEEGWAGFAGCEMGGKIYLVGGSKGTFPSTQTMEFDPVANTWTSKAPLPFPRLNMTLACLEGRVYVIGGWTQADGPIDDVLSLEPVANTWTQRKKMNRPREGAAAAVLDGRIYVTGGRNAGDNGLGLPMVEAYNPELDAWEDRGSCLLAREKPGFLSIGGKLYLFGGGRPNHDNSLNTLEVYNPLTATWKFLQPMLAAHYAFAYAGVGNRILILGGTRGKWDSQILNEVEEYFTDQE